MNKVLTVKLNPSPEQWRRISDLAWQGMRYRNLFIRGRLLESMTRKLWPEIGKDTTDITKLVRAEEKGELSGAVYSALEREAQGAWTRDAKRILAGAPLSQWREADGLSVRGHKNESDSGIRIRQEGNTFYAEMALQNKDCEGGCWISVEIAGKDLDWKLPMLKAMGAWEIPIAKGVISIKKDRGKMLLRLTYPVSLDLPKMGDRVATLSAIAGDKRMLLRTETQTRDYTHKLADIFQKKESWDLIRRRVAAQIGRHRGAARAKRRKFANDSFDDWSSTFLHQWTRDIVEWCKTQGVGHLSVAGIVGGDWPAYKFLSMLQYKAEEAGMKFVEAKLDDQPTERAVDAAVKKQRKKAKKVGEAVRTLAANL